MKKRGKPSIFTKEKQNKIALEYLRTDKSLKDIAEKYGVSIGTIYNWVSEYKRKEGNENGVL